MSQVYYNDPSQWYAREADRRDEQMRGLLNMVMAAKKFKYDQGQDEWTKGFQERQLAETTRRNDIYDAAQTERVQYPPEYIAKMQHPELFKNEVAPGTLEKDLEYIKGKYKVDDATAQKIYLQLKGGGAGGNEPKATEYDKRVAAAEAAYKRGEMTLQELTRVRTGYGEDVTPRQNLQVRAGVDLNTQKARSGLAGKYKINKKTIGTIKQTEGLNPDFPMDYDISSQRILKMVGDESDIELVKKYDDMFKFYQELVNRGIDKATFMKMEAPADIDKNTIAYWYDFYK